MPSLVRLGLISRRGFGRITPDPFVLAIGLTLAVMGGALVVGGPDDASFAVRFQGLLEVWTGSGGLWKLLTFGMQASLMLVLGTALAEAPSVRGAIERLAGRARTPRRLVGLVAMTSIALGLLNWSVSLIGGALVARAAGRHARARGWSLDYPLLAAAGYSGLMVWHGGLSGTAPLKMTSMPDAIEVLGPDLAAQVGTLSLETTLLGTLNLVISGGLLFLGPLFFMALTPSGGEDPEPRAMPAEVLEAPVTDDAGPGPGQDVAAEDRPLVVWLLALPMLAGLGIYAATRGLGRVDLNTVNLMLWVLAMLLHGRPSVFVAACERGIRGATGIFLQFPLYAGIMGMMAASGLSTRLSTMVADAGATLLPVVTFASAALLNLFVPSGGGQWAVQGPIIMQAAVETGVDPAKVLMAMAYGDQLTNMLQPFWALPLLAITGCKAREIVGYTALFMVAGAVWIVAALLLIS